MAEAKGREDASDHRLARSRRSTRQVAAALRSDLLTQEIAALPASGPVRASGSSRLLRPASRCPESGA